MDKPCIELVEVSKKFSGAQVLDKLNLTINEGEIYGLMGDTRSGKSLIVNIINGAQVGDEGVIKWKGQVIAPSGFSSAQKIGIATVFQENTLIDAYTIEQNVRIQPNIYKRHKERLQKLRIYTKRLGIDFKQSTYVNDLSSYEKVLLSIALALVSNPKLLVIDDVCNNLMLKEQDKVFPLIAEFAAEGGSVLFIGSDFEQMCAITSRCGVLCNGAVEFSFDPRRESSQEVTTWINGEPLVNFKVAKKEDEWPICFSIKNFFAISTSNNKVLRKINLNLSAGSINGIFCADKEEREFFLNCLSGIERYQSRGTVMLGAHDITHSTINQRHAHGFVYLPFECIRDCLTPYSKLQENLLVALRKNSFFSVFMESPMLTTALLVREKVSEFLLNEEVNSICEGDLKKFLLHRTRVISTMEKVAVRLVLVSTAKNALQLSERNEIYKILESWSKAGVCVLLLSSSLEEVQQVSHKMGTLHRGYLSEMVENDLVAAHFIEQKVESINTAFHKTRNHYA